MRWLLLLVSILAFGSAFTTVTPGALALALFVGLASLVASVLGFVAARIDAQTQSQMSKAAALVATSRGKVAPPLRRGPATAGATVASDGSTWDASVTGHGSGHGRHGSHHHDADGSDPGGDSGGDSGGGDGGSGGD